MIVIATVKKTLQLIILENTLPNHIYLKPLYNSDFATVIDIDDYTAPQTTLDYKKLYLRIPHMFTGFYKCANLEAFYQVVKGLRNNDNNNIKVVDGDRFILKGSNE